MDTVYLVSYVTDFYPFYLNSSFPLLRLPVILIIMYSYFVTQMPE
jgi:hypothetical protein